MLLLFSFLLFSCVLFITSSSWRHPFSHKKCIFHVILCTFHRILFNKKKIVVYFVLVNDLNNTKKKYMYEVDPLGILKTWMFKTVSLLSFFNFVFFCVFVGEEDSKIRNIFISYFRVNYNKIVPEWMYKFSRIGMFNRGYSTRFNIKKSMKEIEDSSTDVWLMWI